MLIAVQNILEQGCNEMIVKKRFVRLEVIAKYSFYFPSNNELGFEIQSGD